MAKKIQCKKCPRKFSMPAHLARHMNTIHGAGGARKKKVAGRRVGRPKGSTRSIVRAIGGTAFGGAERLLSDMRAYHGALSEQRMSIDTQIDAVATAMQTLGGGSSTRTGIRKSKSAGRKVGRPKGSGARRGRPPGKAPRKGSLKDYIVRVLGQVSKPLSPNDIGVRVMKAGFKTKAKDLTKAVSNTLPTLKKIKRVGFGQYKLG